MFGMMRGAGLDNVRKAGSTHSKTRGFGAQISVFFPTVVKIVGSEVVGVWYDARGRLGQR